MSRDNGSDRWNRAAQLMHNAGLLLLAAVMGGGVLLDELGPASQGYRWVGLLHSLGGVALGSLTLARVVWRWKSPAPTELPLPALHRRGIAAVHALLYAALFAVALSGMAMARTTGWHYFVIGQAPAPRLDGLFKDIHEHAGHVLLMLLALHVAGSAVAEVRQGRVLRRIFGFLR